MTHVTHTTISPEGSRAKCRADRPFRLLQNQTGVMFQLTHNVSENFEVNKAFSRFFLIRKLEGRVFQNADKSVKELEI